MSINDVRLVGELTKDPEFAETSNKKRFARLTLETVRYIRVNGESRALRQVHTVVCFNQFSLTALADHARKGTWIKVLGELTYDRNGKAEITVSQYNGECAIMSIPGLQQEASADNSASGGDGAKATGGLGRLKRTANNEDDGDTPRETNAASGSGRSRKAREPDVADDEIPF